MNAAASPVPSVTLPAEEFLARAEIVAWLGYPPSGGTSNDRWRERARVAIRDYARHKIRIPTSERDDRIEQKLVRLGREVDRQLLAGEIFRRQVLAMLGDDGFFGRTSTRGFAERMATFYGSNLYNATRDFYSKRRSCFALAAGTCFGLAKRPAIDELLFGQRDWALRAVLEAEKLRKWAIKVDHPCSQHLIEFRVAQI